MSRRLVLEVDDELAEALEAWRKAAGTDDDVEAVALALRSPALGAPEREVYDLYCRMSKAQLDMMVELMAAADRELGFTARRKERKAKEQPNEQPKEPRTYPPLRLIVTPPEMRPPGPPRAG